MPSRNSGTRGSQPDAWCLQLRHVICYPAQRLCSSIVCFLLQELNTRYFEPLPTVLPSLQDIKAGPPVKKLLFMTDPSVVDGKLKPHWRVRMLHYAWSRRAPSCSVPLSVANRSNGCFRRGRRFENCPDIRADHCSRGLPGLERYHVHVRTHCSTPFT